MTDIPRGWCEVHGKNLYQTNGDAAVVAFRVIRFRTARALRTFECPVYTGCWHLTKEVKR